jgi:hypothetical protein
MVLRRFWVGEFDTVKNWTPLNKGGLWLDRVWTRTRDSIADLSRARREISIYFPFYFTEGIRLNRLGPKRSWCPARFSRPLVHQPDGNGFAEAERLTIDRSAARVGFHSRHANPATGANPQVRKQTWTGISSARATGRVSVRRLRRFFSSSVGPRRKETPPQRRTRAQARFDPYKPDYRFVVIPTTGGRRTRYPMTRAPCLRRVRERLNYNNIAAAISGPSMT